MMWYDYIFGGRKAFLGLVGACLLTYVFLQLPQQQLANHFWNYVVGLCACLGIFVFGNIKEHQILNGSKK